MFKNYLITAYRNIIRFKLSSLINIIGLALGLASCILIFLYVYYELTFDRFFPNRENIYLVQYSSYTSGGWRDFQNSPGTYRDPLQTDIPEVQAAARMYSMPNSVKIADRTFSEPVRYVDQNFFEIFKLPMLNGALVPPLKDQGAVLLSESQAEKFFGSKNPVGEILTINARRDYRVAGVIKDMPRKSHMSLDIVVLFVPQYFEDQPWVMQQWTSATLSTYVQLDAGADPIGVERAFPALIDKYQPPFEGRKASENSRLSLLNISDIHMKGANKAGNMTLVVGFSAISVLILVIAGINFTNLSTARSLKRAREIGLRKVMGAQRSEIIFQFLMEAILTALIALILAFALVEIFIPFYREFIDRHVGINYSEDGIFLLYTVFASLIIGVCGGLYPAFILSAYKPSQALKKDIASGRGLSGKVRSALVVFQFSISIVLMICTAIVYAQLDFAENSDNGFNKDNKIILHNIWQGRIGEGKSDSLKAALLRNPDIISITRSFEVPGSNDSMSRDFRRKDKDFMSIMNLAEAAVDVDFFRTFQIELLAGRQFQSGRDEGQQSAGQDQRGHRPAILNETAIRSMGFKTPETALGQVFGSATNGGGNSGTVWSENIIIGVVPDLHYRSFHENIRPMVYFVNPFSFNEMVVHFKQGVDREKLTRDIEKTWEMIVPGVKLRFNYLDEMLAMHYQTDRKSGELFFIFSALAIIIASLGLYGLIAINVEQRTREIGIRKIVGASVFDIVKLLVWQFSRPVVLANVVAWPLAFYFTRDYLNGFQYRIDIHPGYFLVASLLALLIACITVSWHAIKMATDKPIKALRYE